MQFSSLEGQIRRQHLQGGSTYVTAALRVYNECISTSKPLDYTQTCAT